MTIDYSTPGKVSFTMNGHKDGIIPDAPDELLEGELVQSTAASHLYEMNTTNPTFLDLLVPVE